ncbi:MAG: type IV secretion protein IcmD [Gammaproteobacteria bacterium]|nr:type IV secretion protein IcmD [Gammaproteobacteria bacterium]
MLGRKIIKSTLSVGLGAVVFYAANALAATSIADMANTLGDTYKGIGKLMVATAYLAGFGLTIAAIFKFKQHKDNPQQVTMGVPITMLLVGIALIFLPNIIAPAGTSLFGSGASAGGFTGEGVDVLTQ